MMSVNTLSRALTRSAPRMAASSSIVSSSRAFSVAPVAMDKASPEISEMHKMHKTDNFDKWVIHKFGKAGKYNNATEVPDQVTTGEINNAKSKFRMIASNFMMALTIGACIVMIYKGKQQTHDDSLETKNMERHKQWKSDEKK